MEAGSKLMPESEAVIYVNNFCTFFPSYEHRAMHFLFLYLKEIFKSKKRSSFYFYFRPREVMF